MQVVQHTHISTLLHCCKILGKEMLKKTEHAVLPITTTRKRQVVFEDGCFVGNDNTVINDHWIMRATAVCHHGDDDKTSKPDSGVMHNPYNPRFKRGIFIGGDEAIPELEVGVIFDHPVMKSYGYSPVCLLELLSLGKT
jgi:hypothetical protein